MYISKLILNPMNYQARSDVANPYEMHRTLCRAFVNGTGVNKFLFRIESSFRSKSQPPVVLVQSDDREPNYQNIKDEYSNYFLEIYEKRKSDKTLLDVFSTNKPFYFRLVANATRKVEGKRFGLYTQEEQIKWLDRKGKLCGFLPVNVNVSDFVIGNKARMRRSTIENLSKRNIYNLGVQYDGILKISDAGRFLESYLRGIGPAKSFGFGLMTLKKVR